MCRVQAYHHPLLELAKQSWKYYPHGKNILQESVALVQLEDGQGNTVDLNKPRRSFLISDRICLGGIKKETEEQAFVSPSW